MKKSVLTLSLMAVLAACGRSETAQTDSASTTPADSVTAAAPAKPENCKSVVEPAKLGKADEYQESGKDLKVTLTLNQADNTTPGPDGCYFNNLVDVTATRKSGKPVFRRTLIKEDLGYFSESDAVIEKGVLQSVQYKPTFNSQKYVSLTMRLRDPETAQTTDFTVYMNYNGEILRVK
ncbi:hypothetical protein F5984_21010 [Rudanella paleaurantiibacter]|uniref:DUF4625 domain-containing protein n=1 Tax=Rudanella paleaurantiibacter TaxID=2614655 RepID=A0A7J5TUG3_9BACT|nr:hypothetical protein [Rudanella paleaurantiibacter]KAB7727553.1 hypothetical protein F5984_21010 [Rudanella paleaurantiibacter]